MLLLRCAALVLFLRLLLGFISGTQDGAHGLISEPSRGPGETAASSPSCPHQTRVRPEQKACPCLMHPSFAAPPLPPFHPRDFKFRQAGRQGAEIKESHSYLPTRRCQCSVAIWERAPVKSKQALGLIAEAGPCQEIRNTAAESNEMPSDFSMPSVTRFRGIGRIWLGALGPGGQLKAPRMMGAATRDDDWGSSTLLPTSPSGLSNSRSRALIADR